MTASGAGDRKDGMHESPKPEHNDWVRSQLDADMHAAHALARVVSVHRDRFVILAQAGEVPAELSGSFLHAAGSAADLPTTGDWVYVDLHDDDSHAIIHGLLPRKTLLKRKSAGRRVDMQLIAANIDVAFIVQSADQNFNLRRLERYLVMVHEGGIEPIVLLSKCDLMSEDELVDLKAQVRGVSPELAVHAFSSLSGDNLDTIQALLLPGSTYCLLGSSGVGKTTLLNSVLGSAQFETQAVSGKHGKGKHTTTSRELIRLDSGAHLIDTPGMRELGSLAVDAGMDETFAEVLELAGSCKFSDCSHLHERGCALLGAVESGELSQGRYDNYLKMKKESEFNDMSLSERRTKDRAFGKMVKSAIRNKKR